MTLVELLTDIIKLLLLLQSLGELCVDINLSLSAGLSWCIVWLHLVTVDALTGTEFFKV